jgi:hypothetical protein
MHVLDGEPLAIAQVQTLALGAPPSLLDLSGRCPPCMAVGTPPLQFRMIVDIHLGQALTMTFPSQFAHLSYSEPQMVVPM